MGANLAITPVGIILAMLMIPIVGAFVAAARDMIFKSDNGSVDEEEDSDDFSIDNDDLKPS